MGRHKGTQCLVYLFHREPGTLPLPVQVVYHRLHALRLQKSKARIVVVLRLAAETLIPVLTAVLVYQEPLVVGEERPLRIRTCQHSLYAVPLLHRAAVDEMERPVEDGLAVGYVAPRPEPHQRAVVRQQARELLRPPLHILQVVL